MGVGRSAIINEHRSYCLRAIASWIGRSDIMGSKNTFPAEYGSVADSIWIEQRQDSSSMRSFSSCFREQTRYDPSLPRPWYSELLIEI